MRILRIKMFSSDTKEKQKKKSNNKKAAIIGGNVLLGAITGNLASSTKAGKNFNKEYDNVISKYEEELERRAQRIKAMGADPAEVEIAKHMKFVSDSNKLYDLARKRGEKAYNKTTLKGVGIGAVAGLGAGIANEAIIRHKRRKKKVKSNENTKN